MKIIEIICSMGLIWKYELQYTPQGINAAFGYNTAQALSDEFKLLQLFNNPEQCM